MGIGSKIAGFLKETWDGIMSPVMMNDTHSYHRAGWGDVHRMTTGTNQPAAFDEHASEPAVNQHQDMAP